MTSSRILAACTLSLLAASGPAVSAGPEKVPEVSLPATILAGGNGLLYLGSAPTSEGSRVEGYAIVHTRPEKGKRPVKARASKETRCYAPIAEKTFWVKPAPYVLSAANDDGLTENQVARILVEAIEAWNKELGFTVFGGEGQGSADGPDMERPDGRNEFMFARFKESSILSMTVVWGIFAGPPEERRLVEWDIVLNDDKVRWGDLGPTREDEIGDESVMDLLNVLTHEIGHAAGMHHPPSACTDETMYGRHFAGETRKRTLGQGDYRGIIALYQPTATERAVESPGAGGVE